VSFTFRPAAREDVSLLIGLSGGTGSGKTYSAMRLAKGIAGDRPFAVIDTEASRARHYADQFRFDHGDLMPPFTPDAYANAIAAADAAKYPVIVVDSASHEWAGEGGVLEAQEAELYRMAKDDYNRREACKMASWIKPKTAHKHMVQRLLQVRAHLILCFRAEPKIEMVKGSDGKWEIREKQSLTGLHGWMPICEKNLPFEMTASFLLMADRPGVPQPIKLQQQHRALFLLDQPITEACGAALAAWARGGVAGRDQRLGPAATSTAAADARSPVVDWPARIAAAATPAALKAIGQELEAAKATVAPAARTALREQFKARALALGGAVRPGRLPLAVPTAKEVFK
jgi:hypothetical protein